MNDFFLDPPTKPALTLPRILLLEPEGLVLPIELLVGILEELLVGFLEELVLLELDLDEVEAQLPGLEFEEEEDLDLDVDWLTFSLHHRPLALLLLRPVLGLDTPLLLLLSLLLLILPPPTLPPPLHPPFTRTQNKQ